MGQKSIEAKEVKARADMHTEVRLPLIRLIEPLGTCVGVRGRA